MARLLKLLYRLNNTIRDFNRLLATESYHLKHSCRHRWRLPF